MAKARDYKAEYERRISRATAAGKTRQAARGHKVREHVERRQKEIVRYGLTIDQLKKVNAWGERRAAAQPTISFFMDNEDLVNWTKRNGFDQFSAFKRTWERERRKYKRAPRPKGEASLDDLYDGIELDELAPEWTYYH